jgi:glycosyltransferase involved in cell wall biosynthesis
MKISVIIPAYNVENYIDRCLKSIATQNLPQSEYEIIIVNDGSKDKTLDKLKVWEKSSKNIHVYSQENQGQSSARNFALLKASGKYIFYIDADDYIESNVLNELYLTADKYNLDLLRFKFVDNGDTTFSGEYNKVYDGIEFALCCSGIWTPCKQIILRKHLIDKDLFFKEQITSEDAELMPKIYLSASRSMALNMHVYHYVYNQNSTTKLRKNDYNRLYNRISSQLVVMESCFELGEKFKNNVDVIALLNKTVFFPTFTAFCHMIFYGSIPFFVARSLQNRYQCSKYFPVKIEEKITFKQRMMFKIMNSRILFNLFYITGIKFLLRTQY